MHPFFIAGLVFAGLGLLFTAKEGDGVKLIPGPQGEAGKDGRDGAQGPAGKDGKDGKDGKNAEKPTDG